MPPTTCILTTVSTCPPFQAESILLLFFIRHFPDSPVRVILYEIPNLDRLFCQVSTASRGALPASLHKSHQTRLFCSLFYRRRSLIATKAQIQRRCFYLFTSRCLYCGNCSSRTKNRFIIIALGIPAGKSPPYQVVALKRSCKSSIPFPYLVSTPSVPPPHSFPSHLPLTLFSLFSSLRSQLSMQCR